MYMCTKCNTHGKVHGYSPTYHCYCDCYDPCSNDENRNFLGAGNTPEEAIEEWAAEAHDRDCCPEWSFKQASKDASEADRLGRLEGDTKWAHWYWREALDFVGVFVARKPTSPR